MFLILIIILQLVILIQIVKCRRDIQEIDCPAAKEVKKLKNKIRPM